MTDPGTPPKLGHLPLADWGYTNCPAIPYWLNAKGTGPDIKRAKAEAAKLKERGKQKTALAAYAGLTTTYTIGGNPNKPAIDYLYGENGNPADPLCHLPLDDAGQFTLPWTNDGSVYQDSLDLRDPFADRLKNKEPDVATHTFWRTIAFFGIPYNLLMLSKVTTERAAELAAEFGEAWTKEMDSSVAAGLTYEINTRIIEEVQPYTPEGGAVRFAPGCITVLTQNAQSKDLTPTLVKLFTSGASGQSRVYKKGGDAWVYALTAAKTSITVWGIWLGHVFHWHIPTAAMQMTMYNELPLSHPLMTFLAPQSQFLIDFDFVLLQFPGAFAEISPPTPVEGPMPLLALLDSYAADHGDFFGLDPLAELASQRIDYTDFTRSTKWDAWPVAGYLIDIWGISESFATVVVNQLYKQDGDVAGDTELQAWIGASQSSSGGNVKLPNITTKPLLTQLLTSLLYRVTAHAAGSMSSVVNPTLAFMANFPPCLQSTDMPTPEVKLSDADLLKRMPYTGTMGTMGTFYFTFAYSQPWKPAIPTGGFNLEPYWPDPGTPSDQACNAALFKYRKDIHDFVVTYTKKWNAELAQIAGVTVGPIPAYAAPKTQAEQWPRSIEI